MRPLSFILCAVLAAATLLACPGPKVPKGPPPEYESPPPPSWLVDGGTAPTPSASDAGVVPGS